MDPADIEDFERAQPLRPDPELIAAVVCGALSCLAIGALIGVYFAGHSISLF